MTIFMIIYSIQAKKAEILPSPKVLLILFHLLLTSISTQDVTISLKCFRWWSEFKIVKRKSTRILSLDQLVEEIKSKNFINFNLQRFKDFFSKSKFCSFYFSVNEQKIEFFLFINWLNIKMILKRLLQIIPFFFYIFISASGEK